MLLDFDKSVETAPSPSACAVGCTPVNKVNDPFVWEPLPGLPPIRCNVDPARQLPPPGLAAALAGTVAWSLKTPVEAVVQLATFGTAGFLGYSAATTLYHYWQIDCNLGAAVRCFFVFVALMATLVTWLRLKWFKLAPLYAIYETLPAQQAAHPFLRTRFMSFQMVGNLLGAYMWSLVPVLYFLVVAGRTEGCTRLCCPPEGVKVGEQLPWGGGGYVMVDETVEQWQLWAYVLLWPLLYVTQTQLSSDPVQSEVCKLFPCHESYTCTK